MKTDGVCAGKYEMQLKVKWSMDWRFGRSGNGSVVSLMDEKQEARCINGVICMNSIEVIAMHTPVGR